MILTAILAAWLVSALAENIPDECRILLAPSWTLQALVIELRLAEPDEGPGVVAHIRSSDGCGADVIFHEPDLVLAVGDLLELKGTTEGGEVFVGNVRRIIHRDAL